jgi:hypothetical protein
LAKRLALRGDETGSSGPANKFAWKTLRRMNAGSGRSRIHAPTSVPCEFIRRLEVAVGAMRIHSQAEGHGRRAGPAEQHLSQSDSEERIPRILGEGVVPWTALPVREGWVTVNLTPIGIGGAFLAGLASFLSPCVFPLVPGYLP